MTALDELLEMSHMKEDNLVIPLVLEYFEAQRLGYDPRQILDGMKQHYTRLYEVKNESAI